MYGQRAHSHTGKVDGIAMCVRMGGGGGDFLVHTTSPIPLSSCNALYRIRMQAFTCFTSPFQKNIRKNRKEENKSSKILSKTGEKPFPRPISSSNLLGSAHLPPSDNTTGIFVPLSPSSRFSPLVRTTPTTRQNVSQKRVLKTTPIVVAKKKRDNEKYTP